ncbi:BZ3500_MvSof-1268-A1-R1_Chr4-1g06796 [Microbotryum saponariae]|uniref:Protein phosphatase n=1 Tax=Microbotryum saponariae TaxID=289078 RepID=A0A2X0M3A6_9BASI|nr:BZ3500_MvSof-1268-A1-R1_Chr4-1g06796 [Microbotryum saponariae]SDA06453.1 BZ3501_MvSof-1269-A2-R1_Chr4-1g06498 [Microbotryum saponariae]
MLLQSTRSSSASIVHRLTNLISQSSVVVFRSRPFSSTPLGSAFVPSRAVRRYRFETAYAFKGKPGSPTFSSRGTDGLTSSPAHGSSTDAGLDSDPSSSDSDPASDQSTFTRPDWRNRSATPRLQQGLDAHHPAMVWRDAVWSRSPCGAGHDWFFVQEVQRPTDALEESSSSSSARKDLVIGVADGVGGWVDLGVDPSLFAQATQTLMWFCRQEVAQNGHKDPLRVIQNAYAALLQEKGVLAGSSTACVVSFDAETGNVLAANLGDSTFLLLRRRPPTSPTPAPTTSRSSPSPPTSEDIDIRSLLTHKVVYLQASQTHFFNAPKQLAKRPKWMHNKHALIDVPEGADLYQTVLQDGDILVLATDGFSDNVWPNELEQLVALVQEHEHELSPFGSNEDSAKDTGPNKVPMTFAQGLANACVNFANTCAFKENKISPFEIEARRYGYNDLRGGKIDDVCVVVVVVKKD